MSEVLSMAKDAPESPKESSPNSKVAIIAAILTAVSTILVSFIGIVPQLRRSDTEAIKLLKQDIDTLKAKAAPGALPTPPEKKLRIIGTVTTLDGKKKLPGVNVFLLPVGKNALTDQTNDSGEFNFEGVPDGRYSIIIQEPTMGKSGRGRLDEEQEDVSFTAMGTRIKYRIRQ